MLRRNVPKTRERRWVRTFDFLVIVNNVLEGMKDKEIGCENPDEMPDRFLKRLNKFLRIYTDDLESALWSCNLLDEKGKFKHPDGVKFEPFIESALLGDRFNRAYNYIEGDKGCAR